MFQYPNILPPVPPGGVAGGFHARAGAPTSAHAARAHTDARAGTSCARFQNQHSHFAHAHMGRPAHGRLAGAPASPRGAYPQELLSLSLATSHFR